MSLLKTVTTIARDVHKKLGPGFNECMYHRAMETGLRNMHIPYQSEVILPVAYLGSNVGNVRADLIIASKLVVELKAVRKMSKDDTRLQTQTYMNLLGIDNGMCVNFGPSLEIEPVTFGDEGGQSERPQSV